MLWDYVRIVFPGIRSKHVKLPLVCMQDLEKSGRCLVRLPANRKASSAILCVDQCRIPKGECGYCGLGHNTDGKMNGASFEWGNLSWYYDPQPTNCVGDWVCAGGTGCGFPQYANCEGPEYGSENLAI